MEQRPKIPREIEALVLFLNEHTCCICRDGSKDVQIHHIDGNRSNNEISNLAVLSLDCHSKVTGTRGLGKKYSALEVKHYKADWERQVKQKRSSVSSIERKPSQEERRFFRFDVMKEIREFAITSNYSRAKEILDLLELYQIFDIDGKFILDEMHEVAPFILDNKKREMLADGVLNYFSVLLYDPKHSLSKKDANQLESCLRLISWMAQLDSFQRKYSSYPNYLRTLLTLLEATHQGKHRREERKISKAVETINHFRKNPPTEEEMR